MSKKARGINYHDNNERSYSAWAGRQAGAGGDLFAEPAEANPDVLPAVDPAPTAQGEATRRLLDDPKLRLRLLSPLEGAVFFAFADGLNKTQMAKKLHRTPRQIRTAVKGLQAAVLRFAARIEAGTDKIGGTD
jgi:DNA-binding NarL/FixJ family response regulator